VIGLHYVIAVDGVAKNGRIGHWPDMKSSLGIGHSHLPQAIASAALFC
jgi:hypothetical protein